MPRGACPERVLSTMRRDRSYQPVWLCSVLRASTTSASGQKRRFGLRHDDFRLGPVGGPLRRRPERLKRVNKRHSVRRQAARNHWFARPSIFPRRKGASDLALVFMDRLFLTIVILGLAVLVSRLLSLWVG